MVSLKLELNDYIYKFYINIRKIFHCLFFFKMHFMSNFIFHFYILCYFTEFLIKCIYTYSTYIKYQII